MPPDFDGNIPASSAWMLFCSAPRVIEIDQSTKAPVVPSAPIEAPSAAIRKPGFASATTKPSHQVIALRSCLSSTSACAIDPSSLPRLAAANDRTNWYSVLLPWVEDGRKMAQVIDRHRGRTQPGAEGTPRRPVVLGTLSVRVDPSA